MQRVNGLLQILGPKKMGALCSRTPHGHGPVDDDGEGMCGGPWQQQAWKINHSIGCAGSLHDLYIQVDQYRHKIFLEIEYLSPLF